MARYTYNISIHVGMRCETLQLDIKTTFLNGVVEEEVYVEQPLGFETHHRKTHVCKLKKDLYGLQ